MILIIDNYDSFTYNLYQLAAIFYSSVRVVRNDQISLDEIKRLQAIGIILSPGPGRPEQAGICVDLIQNILQKKMDAIPLLGVCLGHQAITIAMGGRVVQAAEIIHGKPDYIYHSQQGIYQSLTSPFQAGRYHSLIAERESLPSEVIVEAENKEKLVMGIRHRHLPIYGVQFHPESILTPAGNALIQEFVAICTHRKPGLAA